MYGSMIFLPCYGLSNGRKIAQKTLLSSLRCQQLQEKNNSEFKTSLKIDELCQVNTLAIMDDGIWKQST